MATGDLVQLATVKSWLGVASSADDALLSALITQISRAIYNYINRSFVLPSNVSEAYDGSGRESLILRNWPVGAISAVVVDGKPIPPGADDPRRRRARTGIRAGAGGRSAAGRDAATLFARALSLPQGPPEHGRLLSRRI